MQTIVCRNVRILAGNLSDLNMASYRYGIMLCSETLVSDMCHVSELLVSGFCRPFLLGQDASGPRDGGIRTRYGEFRQSKFECGCCEMLAFMVCGARKNLHVFSLFRNPDLDNRIFDCLLTSVAAVQAEDVRASFLFVGDLNSHHQKWLGSTTTNRRGVATLSGCNQFAVGPTHARGGTLDLMMTNVPDLVRDVVVAPIGNSDHSSLSVVISMAQAVPNLCVGIKVLIRHQVNWNTVWGVMQDLP